MTNNNTSAISTDTPRFHARMAAARRNRFRRYAAAALFSMYLIAAFVSILIGDRMVDAVAFAGLIGTPIVAFALRPESHREPTSLIQCRIAAARKKRFWRAVNSAFLAIHIVALFTVGFIVGVGWLFWVVAASVIVLPVLAWLEYAAGKAVA